MAVWLVVCIVIATLCAANHPRYLSSFNRIDCRNSFVLTLINRTVTGSSTVIFVFSVNLLRAQFKQNNKISNLGESEIYSFF